MPVMLIRLLLHYPILILPDGYFSEHSFNVLLEVLPEELAWKLQQRDHDHRATDYIQPEVSWRPVLNRMIFAEPFKLEYLVRLQCAQQIRQHELIHICIPQV